jgi:hypothetical protein
VPRIALDSEAAVYNAGSRQGGNIASCAWPSVCGRVSVGGVNYIGADMREARMRLHKTALRSAKISL